MQSRFALRIESGDHAGQIVPLQGPSVTIGRRPGNTLQIADSSVSGRHAEVQVEADSVVLRDLGSTNGTKVGGLDVADGHALAHGDEILLGQVRLRFEDAELATSAPPTPSAPPAAVPSAAAVESDVQSELAQTQVHEISAEKVARSSKRSIVALLVVALLVGGGGAAWFFLNRGGGTRRATLRPVVLVEGNLLAGSYSFEPPEDGGAADPGWETADDAPAGFLSSAAASASGTSGLHAPLGAGEWAEHRSPAVRVQGEIEAQASLAATGSAEVRLGLRFTSESGARRMETWSPPLRSSDHEVRFLRSVVPRGYDRARVVVRARATASEGGGGGGDVYVDDVSLVASGTATRAASSEAYKLFVAGDPGDVASVFKINRVLLSSIQVVRAEDERQPLTAADHDVGVALKSPGGDRLRVFVENPLVARIGTIGAEGYRAHRSSFEANGATSLLLGEGVDLVRVRLAEPARITGRPDGDGFAIEAHADGFTEVVLQVEFEAERAEAAGLARDAREAERNGQLGPALAAWQRLLDDFPYEDALLQQASEARARLLQDGLQRLADVRTELERAAFFGLPDSYREAREEVRATAELFAGSEIETEARALIESIDEELAVLEQDLYSAEIDRLRSIHAMLDAGDMPKLADRVATYLEERYGIEGVR